MLISLLILPLIESLTGRHRPDRVFERSRMISMDQVDSIIPLCYYPHRVSDISRNDLTPFPAFPHSANTNGGREYNVFMKTRIYTQVQIAPPPIMVFNWGRLGRGSNA